MATRSINSQIERQHEPRWPIVLALLGIAALYYSLPEALTPGPSWLTLVLFLLLIVAAVVSHRMGRVRLNFHLGIAVAGLMTVAIIWSLGALVASLPGKKEAPAELLRSAAALWVANILVFATWYWRLDAGGPHARYLRESHTEGAFLFPQMTLPDHLRHHWPNWKPGFIDYLFLAFNTSTAFSPTDVPVLSRWAKGLMMIQSCVSLGTLALLAARAINIL